MVGWLFSYIKINKSENIYISNLFIMISDVSSMIPFHTPALVCYFFDTFWVKSVKTAKQKDFFLKQQTKTTKLVLEKLKLKEAEENEEEKKERKRNKVLTGLSWFPFCPFGSSIEDDLSLKGVGLGRFLESSSHHVGAKVGVLQVAHARYAPVCTRCT